VFLSEDSCDSPTRPNLNKCLPVVHSRKHPHPSMASFDSVFLVACIAQLIYNITWMYTVYFPHENVKMNELKIHIAKGLYYGAVAIAEVHALVNYPWLPKILGGQGIMVSPLPANQFPGYPSPSDLGMMMKIFYLQIFYHGVATFVSTMPGNRTKPEMFVHHCVTMCLLGAAYKTEQFTCATMILLLHDAPDVMVCAVKAFHVLNSTIPTLFFFASMLSAWAYFRLYLLTMFSWNVLTRPGTPSNHVSGVLLFMLVGLHAWWFYLFLKMAMRFATGSGSLPKDITQKPTPGSTPRERSEEASPRGVRSSPRFDANAKQD